MREEALLFGHTGSLVGIITDPPKAIRSLSLPAIILLNAGIVHRVGPNRFYVKMARRLATMGFVVLRFDFSGIGDSKAREDALPFEKSSVSEVQEAINALHETRGVARFILIGLCSGAVIASQTAWNDPRIIGTVLINLPHYYDNKHLKSYVTSSQIAQAYKQEISHWGRISFYNRRRLTRILTGKVEYWNAIRMIGFLINFPLKRIFTLHKKVSSEADHIIRHLHLLVERGIRLLLVYSERSHDIEYLKVISGNQIYKLNSCGKLRIEVIPQANHTFDSLPSQEQLFKVVQEWIHPMVRY